MPSHGSLVSRTTLCATPGGGKRRYQAALERLPGPSVAPPAEDQALARSVTEAGLRDALDAISALPEREQEVVMLVLWSGLSYEEAATALAIPVGTVQSRLSRARAKLQIALSTTCSRRLKGVLMIDLQPAPVPELSEEWIVSHQTALVDALSQRRRRPLKWVALAGATGVAATVSTLVLVGGGEQYAFAGWSAFPDDARQRPAHHRRRRLSGAPAPSSRLPPTRAPMPHPSCPS